MERTVPPLRDSFSARVLESKAAGPPIDSGVRESGPGAEPQERYPEPELSPCSRGALLPGTPHPEDRRVLRVRPASACSALAAAGQPRDAARWMLCVAGAKLKVSGSWARSSLNTGGPGGRQSWLERTQGSLALSGSPQRPWGALAAPACKVCTEVNLAELF